MEAKIPVFVRTVNSFKFQLENSEIASFNLVFFVRQRCFPLETFSSANGTIWLVSNKMLDNDSVDGLRDKSRRHPLTSVKFFPAAFIRVPVMKPERRANEPKAFDRPQHQHRAGPTERSSHDDPENRLYRSHGGRPTDEGFLPRSGYRTIAQGSWVGH